MSVAKQLELSPEIAEQAWELLSGQLDAFCEHWERDAHPPEIAPFVTGGSPALRRIVLVELLKIDLDFRWSKNRQPRLLEEYFQQFPELAVDLPADLLYEEYHIRRRQGHPVAVEEYAVRFPQRYADLQRLMGISETGNSTALVHRKIPAAVSELKSGDKIDDFDLLTCLGEGTFARVFLAWQRSMHRLVALKVSGEFGNEPQTLAQLDHENIVRAYDQRYLPERGVRLLYMQYLPGGSLQALVVSTRAVTPALRTGDILVRTLLDTLTQRGEAPAIESSRREQLSQAPWGDVVVWIGAQLARALDYAHQRGILHRDIKPANVLISSDASPRLVDFNVSFCDRLEGVTPAAFFGGSLVYMSPEQLEAFDPNHPREAASLDGRSDLYSLGVVLWELQTSARPFPDLACSESWSSTLQQMIEQRRAGPVAHPDSDAAWRDAPELKAVVLRCLASDPAERWESAAELARNLELLLKPATRRLFHPAPGSWRHVARRFPLLLLMIATILPNAIAAVFNLAHNRSEIIERLQGSREVFERTQLCVNSTVFPLGLFLILWLSRPIRSALAQTTLARPFNGARGGPGARTPSSQGATSEDALAEDKCSSDSFVHARRRCRRLGHISAGLSLLLWLISAPIFPIVLHLKTGSIPFSTFVHFIVSLTLCGLIAVAYPFFGVNCLSIGSFYAPLTRLTEWSRQEQDELARLSQASWFYLLLAASVPLMAVGVLAFSGSQTRFALGALAVFGVLGLTSALAMFRTVQTDLAALASIETSSRRLPLPGETTW